MDNKAVGLKIKEYRKKKKLTQKELAELINRTESSIRKYEKGLIEIPNSILEKIAEALEVNITDLIDITILNSNIESEIANTDFLYLSKPRIPGEISLKMTKENYEKYKHIFLLTLDKIAAETSVADSTPIYDAKTGTKIVYSNVGELIKELDDEHKFLFLSEIIEEIRYHPILNIFSIIAKSSTFNKKEKEEN